MIFMFFVLEMPILLTVGVLFIFTVRVKVVMSFKTNFEPNLILFRV